MFTHKYIFQGIKKSYRRLFYGAAELSPSPSPVEREAGRRVFRCFLFVCLCEGRERLPFTFLSERRSDLPGC